jgi:hypothetical protein
VSEIDTSDPASPFYSEAENDEKYAAYRRVRHEIEFGDLTEAEAQEYELLCQLRGKTPMTKDEEHDLKALMAEQRECQSRGQHLPDECPVCHEERPRSAFRVDADALMPRCFRCTIPNPQEGDGDFLTDPNGRVYLQPRKQRRLNFLAQLPTEAALRRRSALAVRIPKYTDLAPLKFQEYTLLRDYCRAKGYES